MSSYACRDHPNQAVTWRGTGCRTCAKPADERWRDESTAQAAQQEWRNRETNPIDQEVTP